MPASTHNLLGGQHRISAERGAELAGGHDHHTQWAGTVNVAVNENPAER